MIAHHAQALEMARLAAARGSRSEIAVLAERIELSQGDEIRMMTSWLEARGEEPPASDGHADHGAHGAGMLTPEEMQRLADATGPAFDALFLELMIKHHEGALAMVAELLATPGAAQEPEVFAFASDVEAEQRIEIARMRRMLLEVTNR